MISLTPIHASKVRDVWPVVRIGLDAMLTKYKDRWIPEDVFLELRTGTAFLHMIDDADLMNNGFIVVKVLQDVDGPVLFVWILYADAQKMKEDGRYIEVLAELDKMAKSIGAKRIRHFSHRGGWTAKGMFKLKMHVYEREV